jgi:molybdate transport system permease protein
MLLCRETCITLGGNGRVGLNPARLSNRRVLSNGTVGTLLLGSISLVFILFILLPIAAIFVKLSPGAVFMELHNSSVLDAMKVGLATSSLATIVSFAFGVPTAYLLATRDFRGKSLVDSLLDLPMVLPPAVAGLALLLAFAPRGLLGPALLQLGIILPGNIFAVVLAQLFVASPFILRSAKTAFENVPKKLVDNARILTPSGIRVFVTVTLPLSMYGVMTGLVMTWARSMGEFGATLMFAGNLPGVTQTMPLAIYMLMAQDPLASNLLSAILVVISFLVLALFKVFDRRRYGARL